MKDNEYLEYGDNKEIEEYQRFEAVEYYKVKETAQSPFENYNTSEENNSSYTNNNTNTRIEDERERLDRLEKMQSQDASGHKETVSIGNNGVANQNTNNRIFLAQGRNIVLRTGRNSRHFWHIFYLMFTWTFLIIQKYFY